MQKYRTKAPYKLMKKLWKEDENCIQLRELSQCAKHWPHID